MLRLVCRTPTGHFAAAVSAITLDEALTQRPAWMPAEGVFSLEPLEINPYLARPAGELLACLNRHHPINDGSRTVGR